MNEKPIERLKYYNGQRLKAGDFELEQRYHIRVRRWLNKSLFSAGIAEGLEVRRDSGNPQQVIISPGLALDKDGHEIILLEEVRLPVVGKPSKVGEPIDGNYLTIQYREETRAEESDSCAPRGNGRDRGRPAWGGPSRIRATPLISWSDAFPHESSGKIVLAQVELDEKCQVRHVHAYPRRYIGPASAATVRQYALEGERHIDAHNPGRIYFHIRGRQPNAVTLYLRAEKFSTLYYTEMGKHNHTGNLSGYVDETTLTTADTTHHHGTSQMVTKIEKEETFDDGVTTFQQHQHYLFGRTGAVPGSAGGNRGMGVALTNGGPQVIGNDLGTDDFKLEILWGRHRHDIDGDTDPGGFTHAHKHSLSLPAVISDTGVDPTARTGTGQKALTYVANLQVYIGRVDQTGVVQPAQDYTRQILTQLKNLQPTVDWTDGQGNDALGDGSAGHALAEKGAGPIRLDLLSPNLSFPEGQYYIDLQVASGGGRILYNLYVE